MPLKLPLTHRTRLHFKVTGCFFLKSAEKHLCLCISLCQIKMANKVCSRKRQKLDQSNALVYKPREGDIAEEEDGVFISIHGDDGKNILIYNTDVKQKAAEPICIALPVEKPKCSQKTKMNNTTVSDVVRIRAATNVPFVASKCCNERIYQPMGTGSAGAILYYRV